MFSYNAKPFFEIAKRMAKDRLWQNMKSIESRKKPKNLNFSVQNILQNWKRQGARPCKRVQFCKIFCTLKFSFLGFLHDLLIFIFCHSLSWPPISQSQKIVWHYKRKLAKNLATFQPGKLGCSHLRLVWLVTYRQNIHNGRVGRRLPADTEK